MTAGAPAATGPRVLMVSSELAPFASTGGLGEVMSALPPALAALGAHVHVVLPAYGAVDWEDLGAPIRSSLLVPGPDGIREVAVRSGRRGAVALSALVADDLFARPGIYGGPHGDHPDNAARFACFARAVLALAARLDPAPEILHCHDWPSALVPALARSRAPAHLAAIPTVLTIHNLGYQGIFPAAVWPVLGLPDDQFGRHFEFHGQVNFLKGGLITAAALTTVSPRYAREILEPEHGFGLDGVLRERRGVLHGILNGIDATRWDPARDPHLPARFDATDLTGKDGCKAALQREMGLPVAPGTLVLAVISRLAEQKGIDLLLGALPALRAHAVQLIVLGSGEARYEEALRVAARAAPAELAVAITFDDALAHRIVAGADALLMPSRYEPCGLAQLHALRYGTVPIVRATGGLDDTVEEYDPARGDGTGFKFTAYDPAALAAAVGRARAVHADPARWASLRRAGMARDFSWASAALRYLALYAQLVAAR